MSFKIQLFIYENDKKIKTLRLEEGEYILGKDENSDIVIKDEYDYFNKEIF